MPHPAIHPRTPPVPPWVHPARPPYPAGYTPHVPRNTAKMTLPPRPNAEKTVVNCFTY